MVCLGPRGLPCLGQTSQGVVLHVGALAVGVDGGCGHAAQRVADVGRDMSEVVGGDRLGRFLAGGRSVGDGGRCAGGVGGLGLAAEGVVLGGGRGHETGPGSVLFLLLRDIALGGSGACVVGAVVEGAGGRHQVARQRRRGAAGLGHRSCFGHQVQQVDAGVAVVISGGAPLVPGLGGVATLGDGVDHAVGVEGAGRLGGARRAAVGNGGASLFLLHAGVPGVYCGQIVCGPGASGCCRGVPRGVARGRDEGPAVTVVHGRLSLLSGEGLVVGDFGPCAVGHLRAVDAAEETVLGQSLLALRRVTGQGLYPAVAAALSPGAVLGFGELIVALGPGEATEVAIVGAHDRGSGDVVGLQHLRHDVGVEPVLVGLETGCRSLWRGPDHGVAPGLPFEGGVEALRGGIVRAGPDRTHTLPDPC
ncbi:hypothetical protein SDIAM26S_05754 [Streptomyces diastaticus subsp. diastaticus]